MCVFTTQALSLSSFATQDTSLAPMSSSAPPASVSSHCLYNFEGLIEGIPEERFGRNQKGDIVVFGRHTHYISVAVLTRLRWSPSHSHE